MCAGHPSALKVPPLHMYSAREWRGEPHARGWTHSAGMPLSAMYLSNRAMAASSSCSSEQYLSKYSPATSSKDSWGNDSRNRSMRWATSDAPVHGRVHVITVLGGDVEHEAVEEQVLGVGLVSEVGVKPLIGGDLVPKLVLLRGGGLVPEAAGARRWPGARGGARTRRGAGTWRRPGARGRPGARSRGDLVPEAAVEQVLGGGLVPEVVVEPVLGGGLVPEAIGELVLGGDLEPEAAVELVLGGGGLVPEVVAELVLGGDLVPEAAVALVLGGRGLVPEVVVGLVLGRGLVPEAVRELIRGGGEPAGQVRKGARSPAGQKRRRGWPSPKCSISSAGPASACLLK